jgi:hypothetical protein
MANIGNLSKPKQKELRDEFAMAALSSIDRDMWSAICEDARSAGRRPAKECAIHCYELADAMLEVRDQ